MLLYPQLLYSQIPRSEYSGRQTICSTLKTEQPQQSTGESALINLVSGNGDTTQSEITFLHKEFQQNRRVQISIVKITKSLQSKQGCKEHMPSSPTLAGRIIGQISYIDLKG
jgi:hypothetical protein